MDPPPARSREQEFCLAKYQLLHHQKEALMKALNLASDNLPMESSTDHSKHPRRAASLPSGAGTSISQTDRKNDEDHLYAINQRITYTLTSLLNQKGVSQDDAFRTWIQDRLMQCEQDSKLHRHRMSFSEQGKVAIAEQIARGLHKYGSQ